MSGGSGGGGGTAGPGMGSGSGGPGSQPQVPLGGMLNMNALLAMLQQSQAPQALQLGFTPNQNRGGASNANALAQLEGRYVAPTGAGFKYYQGGPTNLPTNGPIQPRPQVNPQAIQLMLQQAIQQQQAAMNGPPVNQMYPDGRRVISR